MTATNECEPSCLVETERLIKHVIKSINNRRSFKINVCFDCYIARVWSENSFECRLAEAMWSAYASPHTYPLAITWASFWLYNFILFMKLISFRILHLLEQLLCKCKHHENQTVSTEHINNICVLIKISSPAIAWEWRI